MTQRPQHVANTYSLKVLPGCFTPEGQMSQDTQLMVTAIEDLAAKEGLAASVKVDVIAADIGLLIIKCSEEFSSKVKQLPNVEYVEPVAQRRLIKKSPNGPRM